MEIVVNERKNDINSFSFTGVMVFRKESSSCMSITFRATTAHGRTYTNTMVLLSFDKEVNASVNAIPLRTKVKATGYITSKRIKTAEEPAKADGTASPAVRAGEPENVQFFVLTGIEKVDEKAEDENLIEISGTVFRAFVTRNGSITFIVRTLRENHYLKMIKASASPKLGVDFIQLMAAGTRVHFLAHCSGHSYVEEGVSKNVETIVIDSIDNA